MSPASFRRSASLLASAVAFLAVLPMVTSKGVGAACNPQNQLDDCGKFTCIKPINATVSDSDGDAYTCQVCTSTAQCMVGDMNGALYRACLTTSDKRVHPYDMECRTKGLFDPFTWQDGVASVLTFFGGCLASGAGIGGGGIYVPLFILFGWGKGAVERSLGASTGLAIAMITMIAPRRHPVRNRPLMDFEATLLLEPIVLLGTVPGKMLNKVFPSLLIYILLLFLLMLICRKTWRSYRKYADKEKEVRDKKVQGAKLSKSKSLYLQSQEAPLDAKDSIFMDGDKEVSASEALVRSVTEQEAKQPWLTIGMLCLCWATVIAIALGIRFGVDCGSSVYVIISVCYIPALAFFSFWQGRRLNKQYLQKVEIDYEFAEGDLKYTNRNVLVWPLMFFISGLLSSLLGIGGGMVIGPLLLEINLHPVVSNATTALMTLFTASAATLQYFVADTSTWDYFLWYVCITFCSGLIGRKVLQDYLKRTGKQAVVILLLAIVITIAAIMMTVITVMKISSNISAGVPFAFVDLCQA
eukprot:g2011.t1